MNENKTSPLSFIVFMITVLTILFASLKLLNIIHWSWIWVVSPIWMAMIGFILVFIIVYIVLLTEEIIRKIKKDEE